MTILRSEEVEFISWYELPDDVQEDNSESYDKDSQWFCFNGIYYPLHSVMRTDRDDSEYHGVMGLTNTAGLGLVITNCGEGARVDLVT